jgi:hypothetical protein
MDIPLTNLRRIRVQSLIAEILQIVGKHMSDEDRRRNAMRDLTYELFEAMEKAGVQIVTDETRREAGLPPRGPEGWTYEELVALEAHWLEVLRAPMAPTIVQPGMLK